MLLHISSPSRLLIECFSLDTSDNLRPECNMRSIPLVSADIILAASIQQSAARVDDTDKLPAIIVTKLMRKIPLAPCVLYQLICA